MKRPRIFGTVQDAKGRVAPISSKTVSDALEGLQHENNEFKRYLQSGRVQINKQGAVIARLTLELHALRGKRWVKLGKVLGLLKESAHGTDQESKREDVPQVASGPAAAHDAVQAEPVAATRKSRQVRSEAE